MSKQKQIPSGNELRMNQAGGNQRIVACITFHVKESVTIYFSCGEEKGTPNQNHALEP